MAAQWATVPVGEDQQRTQALSQKRKAKNLEWLILPKASPRSRWKVCKGEKRLNLFSILAACLHVITASLAMAVLMFKIFFFFQVAALHPFILSFIC